MSLTVKQLRQALEQLERQGHGDLKLECTESAWTGMYPERCVVVRDGSQLHVELCEILDSVEVVSEVSLPAA